MGPVSLLAWNVASFRTVFPPSSRLVPVLSVEEHLGNSQSTCLSSLVAFRALIQV